MSQKIERSKWSEYQKQIADDKYYYFRSCIRQNFFPGSEKAFLEIVGEDLGRDIKETPIHTSCTGIGYHADIVPLETIMTVVARQFSLMHDDGYENLVCSCITSFGIYTEVLATWEEFPETMERTRKYLKEATGRELYIPKSLAHTSDVIYHLRDEIAAKAKHKLVNVTTGEPLKVVEHIGCHYAKLFPKSGVGGSEFPYVLAGMVDAWGGENVDYPERRHCCGFGFRNYIVQANRGYSIANSQKKLESMAPYKPDFIVANCPGCAMFLDKWQYAIAEMEGVTYGQHGQGIPVLTYEEMAGLVLGKDPWELGMQMHQVDVEPLLDKMGIDYDPAAKYLGRSGKYIGRPASAAVNSYSDLVYRIKQ
ncbi:MAG: heterodisulfide reductase-related iron-sulfur binding cluster [Rikenellaceae bacterium]